MDPIVIVLAAGRGERFRASGGRTDKLSSLLAGRRVRDHVLDAVRASGLACHIVERDDTAHLPTCQRAVQFIGVAAGSTKPLTAASRQHNDDGIHGEIVSLAQGVMI